MRSSSVSFSGFSEKSAAKRYTKLFRVPLKELCFRVFLSFVPPLTQNLAKIPVDLLGPLLAYSLLAVMLSYGYLMKNLRLSLVPLQTVGLYSLVSPAICVLSKRLVGLRLSFYQVVSVFGYAAYGHVVTLLVSYLCYEERSTSFFFVCMIIFSGLSTSRVALLVLSTIEVPAARLIVCSLISVVNVLFVIFWHFAFMHSTFLYGNKS